MSGHPPAPDTAAGDDPGRLRGWLQHGGGHRTLERLAIACAAVLFAAALILAEIGLWRANVDKDELNDQLRTQVAALEAKVDCFAAVDKALITARVRLEIAQAAVVAVGFSEGTDSPGFHAALLDLDGAQRALSGALAASSGNPC